MRSILSSGISAFHTAARGDLKKLLSHLCFLEGNSRIQSVLLKLATREQTSVVPYKASGQADYQLHPRLYTASAWCMKSILGAAAAAAANALACEAVSLFSSTKQGR